MKPLIRSYILFTLVIVALSAVNRIGVAIQVDNVDRLEPIVRRSPASPDNPDDLFGYSLVLHQMVANPATRMEAIEETRIIVGAPRGTFPGGLMEPEVEDYFAPALNETGLVYVCPLSTSNCAGLTGDTTLYSGDQPAADNDMTTLTSAELSHRLPDRFVEGRLFDQAPDAIVENEFRSGQLRTYENKTGQLLGATLYSNGDYFIACAPRWTTTSYNPINPSLPPTDPRNRYEQQPRGICYSSNRTLTGFTVLRACEDANNGRSGNTEDEGYCLQGTSVTIANDQILLGVPGLDENRGAVYRANVAVGGANPDGTTPVTFMMGNVNEVNSSDPNGPLIDLEDQYQAFRIASGFVTRARGTGVADVLAAVPRYNEDTYTGRINVYLGDNFGDIVRTIDAEGSQMGEFFGQALIVADLNGDNFDEVIVGAPMYTDYPNSMIEVGRVYVFYNNNGNNLAEPVILQGRLGFGRFGFALANLGDIDNDGNEDFAVGAPYTRHDVDGNNTGSVYIYYGSDNMAEFMNQIPFEIRATDMVENVRPLTQLQTFGFSLASGIDVDLNEYNDLAIGAYRSQLVVLLRTLPVADVTISSLSSSVAEVNSDAPSSFVVTVTGMYNGRGLDGPQDVNFTLSEVPIASGNRIFFTENDTSSLSRTATLSFTDINTPASESITVYVQADISVVDLVVNIDLLPVDRPITIDVTGEQEISDFQPFPRIRQLGAETLTVGVIDPCLNDGCTSDIIFNSVEPNTITLTAGDIQPPTVTITYGNQGPEDAFFTRLLITNLNTRAFSGVNLFTSGSKADCNTTNIESGEVSCFLRRRIRPSVANLVSELSFIVKEGENSLIGDEGQFTVNLEIIVGGSGNVNDADQRSNNLQSITFNVLARTSITVFSTLPGVFLYTAVAPQAVNSPNDLGQPVDMVVNIGNTGPTGVMTADLTIYVPSRSGITGQNSFLYITGINVDPQEGVGSASCSMDEVDFSGLFTSQSGRKRSIESSSSSWKRTKRDAFKSLKRSRRQTNGTVVPLSCADPEMRSQCTQITCRLQGLPAGSNLVSVTISTREDRRFFGTLAAGRTFNLTAYSTITIINSDIFDGASVTSASAMSMISLQPMTDTTNETDDRSNLIHVIIWPIVGGLIIIVIIAIVLYCVGFFRRKKPEGEEEPEEFAPEKKPPPPVEGVSYKPEGEVVTGV